MIPDNRTALVSSMAVLCLMLACHPRPAIPTLFDALPAERTGLHFTNRLTSTDSLNLFKYMYFYNGAGVAAGDFNNDGLTDLYFASNQGRNALYLNQGGLRFKEVGAEAGLPDDHAWSTGVSVVDINNDGLPDIYVSRVGKYGILQGHNQFLICQGIDKNGIPHYQDKAKEYGLDFSGFGTQAAFFDYDLDGDLDVFLLNHSIHENTTFHPRSESLDAFSPVSGSRLFRNDGDRFTDVTRACGISSSAIGFSLGIAISDVNLDGYPDIYVGNDFHENDYLYINQHDGTFAEKLNTYMMHTSQFTMGVDVADVSNDGYPEVISTDMLPPDPHTLKRSLGEDAYDIFNLKLSYGYNYQYSRNNLQYNRGNENFSETGLYSGVAATDWSWAPLWMDFDNDGWKDLFIANGIPKRMNDIDYINYVSDQQMQQKITDKSSAEKDQELIDRFPQVKLPNKFFRNMGDMRFADLETDIGDAPATYSNGAVYADLDNDGDLDVVVNNIDDEAVLYRNHANDAKTRPSCSLHLKGPTRNIEAIGAKAIVFAQGGIRTYEKFGVHGFLSSMDMPILIGLAQSLVDSAFLVWPDNTYQRFQPDTPGVSLQYHAGLPKFDYGVFHAHRKNASLPAVDLAAQTGLNIVHRENTFSDFDREPLIPRMLSMEGPALAVGDMNGDGLPDVFFGAAKGGKRSVLLQQASGKFIAAPQPALDGDSLWEDVDACWVDVNHDSLPDLVVVSGGNETNATDPYLSPRVYLNDGRSGLQKKSDAFGGIVCQASCVTAADVNGDGFPDLFIGGRAVPGEYGRPTQSFLLLNDGTGSFRDATAQLAPQLRDAGLVTGAAWTDIDGDNDLDLVVCSEWGTVDAYIANGGHFTRQTLFAGKGWWNFILPCDLDGDGRIDLIAGNLGLNSRLRASPAQPVRMYYNDFDDNGKKEQVLTYYLQDKEIPFASKAEIDRQIPAMRKRFLYAKDFANADLAEILTPEKLAGSQVYEADYFDNCVLMNRGGLHFEATPMPWQAQLSAYRSAAVVNANSDSIPDILLVGNDYRNTVEMGRNDADFGSLLLNDGHGGLTYESLNGLVIKGQCRKVLKLTVGGRDAFLVARNNDTAVLAGFVPNSRAAGTKKGGR